MRCTISLSTPRPLSAGWAGSSSAQRVHEHVRAKHGGGKQYAVAEPVAPAAQASVREDEAGGNPEAPREPAGAAPVTAQPAQQCLACVGDGARVETSDRGM